MSTELNWLVLTALMTTLFWVPYVLNRIKVMGLNTAMSAKGVENDHHDNWGVRCRAAHANAVENLVIFAIAVIALHLLGAGTGVSAMAAAIYFFARLAHFIFYAFGVPYLRTISFATGWFATLAIFLTVLGWV